MYVWIISGAGRRAGKTYLAKKLCSILPRAVYAKLGSSDKSPGKQKNYFTDAAKLKEFIESCAGIHEHAVVEANSINLGDYGCIRIFLESNIDGGDKRADAEMLKRKADIVVSETEDVALWKKALRKLPIENEIEDAVISLLSAQRLRLNRDEIFAHSKVWLVGSEMMHVFGPGLAELLAEVEHLGSLKAAAGKAGMSYRHAWGAVRIAEKNLGLKLIESASGGRDGGGSRITDGARRMMALYETLLSRVEEFADAEFARLYSSRVEGENE